MSPAVISSAAGADRWEGAGGGGQKTRVALIVPGPQREKDAVGDGSVLSGQCPALHANTVSEDKPPNDYIIALNTQDLPPNCIQIWAGEEGGKRLFEVQ